MIKVYMGCMGAMMVWVDGCMDGVDECVDGWDEGLEGMRVWRAILLQWGAEFSKAPLAIMTLACPPPQRDTRWSMPSTRVARASQRHTVTEPSGSGAPEGLRWPSIARACGTSSASGGTGGPSMATSAA